MVVDAASHGIIDPGSKADIRPAYQLPLSLPLAPSRPRPSSRRVVPWSLPLEDYVGTSLSSPRVLSNSTRSRAEASAALSSAFSSLISLSPLSPLVHLGLLHVASASSLSSSARTFAALVSRLLQNHTCARPPHSLPVRVLSSPLYTFTHSFFLFFMLAYFVRNVDLSFAIFSIS